MRENEELTELRNRVGALRGEVAGLASDLNVARGEIRACEKILVQILRGLRTKNPDLFGECIKITFPQPLHEPSLPFVERRAFTRLRQILAPFQGKRS